MKEVVILRHEDSDGKSQLYRAEIDRKEKVFSNIKTLKFKEVSRIVDWCTLNDPNKYGLMTERTFSDFQEELTFETPLPADVLLTNPEWNMYSDWSGTGLDSVIDRTFIPLCLTRDQAAGLYRIVKSTRRDWQTLRTIVKDALVNVFLKYEDEILKALKDGGVL